MTKITFEALAREIGRKTWTRKSCLNEVCDLIDSGRINADDTCFVEKSRDAADWDAVALDSVSYLLASCKDKRVINWFARRGVRG